MSSERAIINNYILFYFNKVQKNCFKADEEAIKGGKRCHEIYQYKGVTQR